MQVERQSCHMERPKNKSYILTGTDYYINLCRCGWQFLATHKTEKQCPQCKKAIKFCLKCGVIHHTEYLYCKECKSDKKIYCANCKEEKENPFNVFCDKCMIQDKKITLTNMKKKSQRFVSFLATQTGCPHSYDCLNCPEDDCIVPSDEENGQGRLF